MNPRSDPFLYIFSQRCRSRYVSPSIPGRRSHRWTRASRFDVNHSRSSLRSIPAAGGACTKLFASNAIWWFTSVLLRKPKKGNVNDLVDGTYYKKDRKHPFPVVIIIGHWGLH